MSKLKKISGKECVKLLCNKFGFLIKRQKGSHIVLRKETPNYIYEYICKKGTMTTWSYNCKTLGEKYQCKDGACKQVCKPGPTGHGYCFKFQIDSSITYIKEYQKEDCTTYLPGDMGKDNVNKGDKTNCGYNDDSLCKEDVGCCKDEAIKTECQGDTLYSQTKNSCTDEVKENLLDCSSITELGLPKLTCQTNNNFNGVENSKCVYCVVGEEIYSCVYNPNTKEFQYNQLICKQNTDTDSWSNSLVFTDKSSPTCPSGATCYNNPEGKCA